MPVVDAITVNRRKLLTVTPLKDDHTPAMVDGPVTFTLESGTAIVNVVGDNIAFINMGPTAGEISEVLISVDADLGAGVRTLSETYTVTALANTAEEATSLSIEAGEEEPIP